MVKLYGEKQPEVQAYFLELQKVFFKFLFDMKPLMQDLSSSCLTLIYKLGSEDVKK
jgi:hypothetical protein